MDMPDIKSKKTLVLIGGGIAASLIAAYLWSKFSGPGSSASSSDAALAQYDAQAAASSQAAQQESDSYNLQASQLADQAQLQNQTLAVQQATAAYNAGSSLANSITQLGAVNEQSALQTIQSTYAANYAAGASIADNALQGAATIAQAGLASQGAAVASANNSIGRGFNALGATIQQFGNTTSNIVQSSAQTAQTMSNNIAANTQAQANATNQTLTTVGTIAAIALL